MWQDGEIGPDTLVWTEGMGRRARVRDMPTLLGILRGDEDEDEPVGGRGAGLDQLLADAAEADGERVTDGATTSFGDAALLDAELGSDASSWELNGSRQRAAAAAAAAGRSSPRTRADVAEGAAGDAGTVRDVRNAGEHASEGRGGRARTRQGAHGVGDGGSRGFERTSVVVAVRPRASR